MKDLAENVPLPDKYDELIYSQPLWTGDVMYCESLMFVKDSDGNVPPAPLLYSPDEVLCLKSHDLRTSFDEGRDYCVKNGCIELTPDSRIFAWEHDSYYPSFHEEGKTFSRTGGGYIAFGEGDTFFKTQYAVTYRHSDSWGGIVPQSQRELLPHSVEKLTAGEPFRIVYFGDSITTGANSSMTMPPYAPMWTQMVSSRLARKYGNENITEINTAVGGTASEWGLKNAQELVASHRPDLAVLAFGANDINTPTEVFADNIAGIIELVRKSCPQTEFILVSPWQTNRDVKGFFGNQYTFELALSELTRTFSGCALAPVYSVHSYILTKKRYYDMSGNNVNHPNDFAARMYAHTVSAVLL